MAAQDNLSEQLFHGTPHEFKAGDVIKANDDWHGHGAYATNDHTLARDYASDSVRLGWHNTSWEHVPQQGALMGNVYEVEPLGEKTKTDDASYFVHGGVKVKRKVGVEPAAGVLY